MNRSKFMDKQITELSPSTIPDFPYFSDLHEEEDEEDQLFPSSNFRPIRPLPNSSSMDHIDSGKASFEEVGTFYDEALISVIDEKMKVHTDNFLHVVDALITRLSQLGSRTCNIESYFDELKGSTEYHNERTNGKLRQLENTLREVQGGIQDLRDKQEIMEAQLQLEKLEVSKSKLQAENNIGAKQAHIVQGISSSAPQQDHQPQLVPIYCQQPLPALHSNASPSLNYQNTPPLPPPPPPPPAASAGVQLPMQAPQSQISFSNPGSFYLPNPQAPGTTHQKRQVPPAPQSQLPLSAPHQSYQPAPQLQTSQVPQLPHGPLHFSAANPQVPPSDHSPKEIPYPSSESYPLSFHQLPFQPPSSAPSTQQFYIGSTLKMHEKPTNRPNPEIPTGYNTPPANAPVGGFYAQSGSNSYNNDLTMKYLQLSPLASIPSGGTRYTKLPTAQLLPHALPAASSVGGGSGSSVPGNEMSADNVVEKVAAMGFRRDLVRATVRKLTENGQSPDLNVVLDKLMNDEEAQAQRIWFTR